MNSPCYPKDPEKFLERFRINGYGLLLTLSERQAALNGEEFRGKAHYRYNKELESAWLNGDIKAIDEITFSYIKPTGHFHQAVFWAGDIQDFMKKSNRTFSLHFIYDEYVKSYQWREFGLEHNLPIPKPLSDIQKPITEPQAKSVRELSLDNELNIILNASLPETLNILKKRNEPPYDGVLGCPTDSVTENEKERFESIRNRLLDGDGLTVADIHGLINDCDANAHSFSLIPDRLKQDIRFLASLWRAAKQDKPKAEAVVNTTKADTHKPWLIPDSRDPKPKYPWYVAARYFARQLVLEDSSLLLKREILAAKVTKLLHKVNIKKRGGIKSFNPATVKKAFANVILG